MYMQGSIGIILYLYMFSFSYKQVAVQNPRASEFVLSCAVVMKIANLDKNAVLMGVDMFAL